MYARRLVGAGRGESLDCIIKIEQQCALAIVADHALHPEETRQTHAPAHRRDTVQAAGGVVEHRIADCQLDRLRTISVFDQP